MTDDPSSSVCAGEVAELERAGYALWTAIESVEVGGWTMRANGGFTRRLNSATAVGSADASLEARRRVGRWLAARGIPMTVRMTPLVDPDTRAEVEATWGLAAEADTDVMAKAMAVSGAAHAVFDEVDPAGSAFARDVFALNGRDPRYRPQWEGIAHRLGADGIGLWRPGVAVALVAISGPTAYTFSVAVRRDERRKGIASDLMRAAESWAAARGCTTMALQVTGANTPARALYRTLGYDARYRYTYLEPSP